MLFGQRFVSDIDGSVNQVYSDGTEFRLVHREDHATIYLSSHTGCALACQMCHLTATKQTKMAPLSRPEMVRRAMKLLPEVKSRRVNFAFMARGDALSNPNVDGGLISTLYDYATGQRLRAKVLISTIFPDQVFEGKDVGELLLDRFRHWYPHIYWSLYTLDKTVRDVWMPNACDPEPVIEGLKKWQAYTHQDIVIHHALIEGVNSRLGSASRIVEFMRDSGVSYRVNLVRYNPPDGQSREASESTYHAHYAFYTRNIGEDRVKIQPRVGFDVKASCGMFVDAPTTKKEAK